MMSGGIKEGVLCCWQVDDDYYCLQGLSPQSLCLSDRKSLLVFLFPSLPCTGVINGSITSQCSLIFFFFTDFFKRPKHFGKSVQCSQLNADCCYTFSLLLYVCLSVSPLLQCEDGAAVDGR